MGLEDHGDVDEIAKKNDVTLSLLGIMVASLGTIIFNWGNGWEWIKGVIDISIPTFQ